MGAVLMYALRSVRREWQEAPWFVLLIIGIAAVVAQITFGTLDSFF